MNFEDLSNPLLSLYDEKMSLWGSWLCAQWLHCEAVQLEDWSSMGEEQVKIRNEYSWSVPTEEALRLLALHQPLVELGAGAGYWASLLKQLPVDILAFDEKHFRSSFNERANISQGRNQCIASSNKCLTTSNKKLLGTSASLLVTSALLLGTRSY